MKRDFKKRNLYCLSLLLIALFTSCDKNGETSELEGAEEITVAELRVSDEVELISDEIISIVEELYSVDEIQVTAKSFYKSDYLPNCVTVTTVVSDTSKEITIDFGEGCELPNGNLLSGIIYLSYLKDMEVATKTLSLSLKNFTYNGVEV